MDVDHNQMKAEFKQCHDVQDYAIAVGKYRRLSCSDTEILDCIPRRALSLIGYGLVRECQMNVDLVVKYMPHNSNHLPYLRELLSCGADPVALVRYIPPKKLNSYVPDLIRHGMTAAQLIDKFITPRSSNADKLRLALQLENQGLMTLSRACYDMQVTHVPRRLRYLFDDIHRG